MSSPSDDYDKQVVRDKKVRLFARALVKAGLKRKLCIVVLAERLKHIRLLKKTLKKYNPEIVSGKVSRKDRERIIEEFESGKLHLIIASSVFIKGVNIKRLSMVVDCAQRKSKNDAMQKLGRSVRLHAEKSGAAYFDLWNSNSKTTSKAATSRRTAFKRGKISILSVVAHSGNFEREAETFIQTAMDFLDDKIQIKSNKIIPVRLSKSKGIK